MAGGLAKERLKLILASASPGRCRLLRQAGYAFRVIRPQINESVLAAGHRKPAQYARHLALAKAGNVAERYPDDLVLGADTVVDCQGQIIGKPADEKHAEQIIRKLFVQPHKVITALALVRRSDNIRLVEAQTTLIYPKQLTDRQIAGHIRSRNWYGKAGAYGIKEKDDPFVEKIDGSITNVTGLPIELLEQMLKAIQPG